MDGKIPVLVICLLQSFLVAQLHADSLDITFIDVGEGEAILIHSGDDRALIDTGNSASGERLVNYLQSSGINQLDKLIITHPHPDHIGGVSKVLEKLQVRERLDNGEPLQETGALYTDYESNFRSNNYRTLKQGETLALGDADLVVINSWESGRTWNDNSIVLLIRHSRVNILLMGDASSRVEERLLEEELTVEVELLKLGHHGAADASSKNWLTEIDPDYAVISIDAGNRRGYPSRLVLDRLDQLGIRLFTTYQNGSIQFSSDGSTLTPK